MAFDLPNRSLRVVLAWRRDASLKHPSNFATINMTSVAKLNRMRIVSMKQTKSTSSSFLSGVESINTDAGLGLGYKIMLVKWDRNGRTVTRVGNYAALVALFSELLNAGSF